MASIKQDETSLDQLRSFIETEETLKKHGYVTCSLTEDDLLLKRRCVGCGKTMSQLDSKEKRISMQVERGESVHQKVAAIAETALSLKDHSVNTSLQAAHTNLVIDGTVPSEADSKPAIVFRCKFHPGKVVQKYWTCCSQHVTAQPCSGSNAHKPRSCAIEELARQYQFHATPTTSTGDKTCTAVAIDCEMGTAQSGDSELIRITMIDYFSGKILVNSLVEPDVPMQHLNTRFSGVTWADMRKAKKQGTCLNGKVEARKKVWSYVGPETVVIGHGASNDLRALRWIHGPIVDSFIIELDLKKRKEAEKKPETEIVNTVTTMAVHVEMNSLHKDHEDNMRHVLQIPANHRGEGGETPVAKPQKAKKSSSETLSLKNLVKKRLQKDIQTGGKAGHDSLEDAIAARDLVHWLITHEDHE